MKLTLYPLKIFLLIITMTFSITSAQDGTVDITFGTDGHVLTQILPDEDLKNSSATDVIIQSDGKILASGVFDNFGKNSVALVRYDPDGSIDQSFGEDGIARSFFTSTQVVGELNGLALQSDGKIIISGFTTSATDYDLAVMRFNTDGSVDSSFGTDGRVLTQVGPSQDYAYDMLIQEDDKIVLAGSTHDGLIIDGIIVRYTSDGQLDNTFGNGGIVKTDFSGGADDFRAIAVQSNGKLVAAGYSNNTNTGMLEFALAKYYADGSLDTSFDQDGLKTIGDFLGMINSIRLLDQNQILFVGGTSGGSKVALGRINSDGTLDNSFGNSGLLETNFVNSTTDGPSKILVQNDNKFIVIATTYQSGPWVMSGQRFNSDGTVDNSFGDAGSFFVDLNGQDFSRANSAVMANDGSIFIAGRTLSDKRVGIFSILKINNNSTPLTGIEFGENINKDFKLYNNYPNPFNPSTQIKFSIVRAEYVSLKIYDVVGREVTTLVNEELSTGLYTVTFNASKENKQLSSGAYFYRLTAGNYSETKKLLFLK